MKIELYDTTLRDGAQQSGISLSLKDKINITLKLDELGIDTIEGGYAGSNHIKSNVLTEKEYDKVMSPISMTKPK